MFGSSTLFCYVEDNRDVDSEGGRPGVGGSLSDSGVACLVPPSPQAWKNSQ